MECLEDRTLFSASPLANAVPINFTPSNTAQVSHFLATPSEFDFYRVTLQAGETLDAGISALGIGPQAFVGIPGAIPGYSGQAVSGLASLLRVFDATGTPLALDNQQGGDPSMTFQAATAGTYYVGVSSAPNDNYKPNLANSGTAGVTTGLYTLNLQLKTTTPLMPDLTGSSFRTGADMAAPGEQVPVTFTVENRGGKDPGNFQVQVLLADSNIFDSSSRVLATFQRSELVTDATGRDFSSPAGFGVTVPAGQTSGPEFLGLRILADPTVPEAGLYDKSGVHRGVDWEPLTVVAHAPPGATDLSAVDAGLNTQAAGMLASNQVSAYTFTVSSTLGNGELTAEAAATSGNLLPRLTLSGSNGQVLIQSDSGHIVQSLQPGTYVVTVSAEFGTGNYHLNTAFVQTCLPFAPLPSGAGTASVAVADLTGSGYLDIVTANRIDDTVSVYLGNGDGTFQLPKTYDIGARVWRVTIGDVNGDGKPDIITGNKGANTISVLLGNGDGTFLPQIVTPVGTRPGGGTVADLTGDGIPDLIVDNYADDTIWVLPGNGNGTFGAPTIYPTDQGPGFAGPGRVTVADLTGDGIPDLIYPDYVSGNVSVRLGLGNGTFGPEENFPAGKGAYSVSAVDLTGNGKLDLVVVNAVANTVSVLMGNGKGSFQPEKTYPVGTNPYSLVVADVNGDGIPDIVTSNRGDNTVSVLLGNGDGTFRPETTYPTGTTPRAVAVGDFTGNGNVDVVTANLGNDTASVLFNRGDGTFQAQQSAPAPSLASFQVVVADVNGDGIPDIVTANRANNSVSVLLGNPDGTFQTRETFATGKGPFSVAVADLTGDGKEDVITANYEVGTISVLMGNGDGTFQPHVDIRVGSDPYDVKVADLNGDGIPDIIVTNKNDNTVGVLLGKGNGTFQPMNAYRVASGPFEVVVADLTGDGIPDLVVSHFSATVVDVLLGNGKGTFQPAQEFPVGSRPYGLAVADLTGDGIPDIITSNYRDNSVSVLMGNGNGTFGAPQIYPVGKAPNEVQVADFNGDGIPDIVTANYGDNTVSVLLNTTTKGASTATFQAAQSFPAGPGPASVAVADLEGDGTFQLDGKLDLVVGNRNASTINVLRGNGDGTFQAPVSFGAGPSKYSVAVADLTGDGKQDVITTNTLANTVTVQLGNGDGTFQPPQTVAVGPAPTSVAVADLNGDGRPDLVTTNSGNKTVSVLLGNGDGTFGPPETFTVGRSPRKVVVADLSGDGIPDLVVTNYNDDTVSVLLGNGDGTFKPQEVYAVGDKPYGVTVADVNGDGKPDIIVANSAGDTVTVWLGNGKGAFQSPQTLAVGRQPFSVAVADLNGGKPDIITANAADNTVSVLPGNGKGAFGLQQTFPVGDRPYSVAVVSANGDGKPDLVTTNYGSGNVSLLVNNGNGTFQPQTNFATGPLPVQTVVADVNDDGIPDLVTVNNHDSSISVLLGNGNGSFQPASAATDVGLRDTPFLVDLNGDGIPDSIVLDRSGNILFRKGLSRASNTFAPPVILNPDRPGRDITVVHTGTGVAIAAADAHFDPSLSTNHFVFTVSLYTVGLNGTVRRTTAFSTTALPVRIAAADLTGNGLDDLIVANSLDNSVSIALQTAPGQFAAPLTIPVGITPSDIAVTDVNGDGWPDVVVSDQASGQVTVLFNDASHSFSQTLTFAAGTEPSSLVTTSGAAAISSPEQSVSVVAGNFLGNGRNDLVVVNAGAHSFSVLPNDGQGGFLAPTLSLTTSTSDPLSINEQPGAVVAGDFNRDGKLDLAVLMQDTGQLWIFTGNGNGTFRHTSSIAVGDEATGLSVVPGSAAGLLDLLVGNGFGDVLHLQGKGDGTFQISGNRVSLSVVPDLLGNGQAGVLVGNQQDNRVTLQAPTSGGTQFAPVQTLGSSAGNQLAPGAVQWAVLDKGATLPDAIVVSSGSNAVVVYRTTLVNGVLTFAPPQTLFVGTDPVSVTVADVNGGIPDLLVANQGSNDVSEIFGSYDAGGHWVGTLGPRLKSGGDGPIAVSVLQQNRGLPDLVVTNGGSGTITLLPGVGQGFFDDQHPQTLFNLGDALVQPPTFAGNSSVGYAVTAGGKLLRFDLANPAAGVRVVFATQDVLAAQALENGQVVVGVAGGAVEVLVPRGGSLSVLVELQAQGGVPVLLSALDVLQTAGRLEVLVSSQGSDTLSVFAQVIASNISLVGLGTQGQSSVQVVFLTSIQTSNVLTNLSAVSDRSITVSSSGSTTVSSISLSTAGATTIGLSFTSFSSHETTVSTASNGAILVAVQGNSYATVALLDFWSGNEESGNGAGRMPWLSISLPIGDTSPLMRFVIGQEEAIKLYLGSKDAHLKQDGDPPLNDPWKLDLFQRRQPFLLPVPNQEEDDPMEDSGLEAMLFWEKCADDPRLLPAAGETPRAAVLEALAMLLTAMALPPRGIRPTLEG